MCMQASATSRTLPAGCIQAQRTALRCRSCISHASARSAAAMVQASSSSCGKRHESETAGGRRASARGAAMRCSASRPVMSGWCEPVCRASLSLQAAPSGSSRRVLSHESLLVHKCFGLAAVRANRAGL
ncbi:hypothetical protein QAD02_012548 [Eretmocerus hayati]|uniref:Uncharacterized protein n=1 Tax=Eretmocerus hayati TaxID=131215 RepID=A0ACC2P007_9HYME|nr:hypothetical protein QAD02_012548 [Eretmocerus hayati]